jgi:hypothetical protein
MDYGGHHRRSPISSNFSIIRGNLACFGKARHGCAPLKRILSLLFIPLLRFEGWRGARLFSDVMVSLQIFSFAGDHCMGGSHFPDSLSLEGRIKVRASNKI